jgi:phosphatidate cytidylyltransferase
MAFPLMAVLILFVPFMKNIGVNIMVIAVSIIGTWEMSRLLEARGIPMRTHLVAALGGVLPLLTYLYVLKLFPPRGVLIGGIFLIMGGLIFPIFINKDKDFKDLILQIGGFLMALAYPGLFLCFIVLFSSLDNSSAVIMLFVFTVYCNDSFAWLVGMLFGARTRGFITVSPKKSLVGFLGGLAASTAVCMASAALFPKALGLSLPLAAAMGFTAGCTTILGDLAESGLKRSAGIKDSGNIILGRGGMLDSIDSLLLTAPVFFAVFTYFT